MQTSYSLLVLFAVLAVAFGGAVLNTGLVGARSVYAAGAYPYAAGTYGAYGAYGAGLGYGAYGAGLGYSSLGYSGLGYNGLGYSGLGYGYGLGHSYGYGLGRGYGYY